MLPLGTSVAGHTAVPKNIVSGQNAYHPQNQSHYIVEENVKGLELSKEFEPQYCNTWSNLWRSLGTRFLRCGPWTCVTSDGDLIQT